MLMFERAYNTLMKAWNMSKPAKPPGAKEGDKKEGGDNAQEGTDKDPVKISRVDHTKLREGGFPLLTYKVEHTFQVDPKSFHR